MTASLALSIPQTAWRRLMPGEQRVVYAIDSVAANPCAGERDDARGVYKADVDYIARVVERDRQAVIDALGQASKRRVLDLALVGVNGSLVVIAVRRGAATTAMLEAAAILGHDIRPGASEGAAA